MTFLPSCTHDGVQAMFTVTGLSPGAYEFSVAVFTRSGSGKLVVKDAFVISQLTGGKSWAALDVTATLL